MESMMNQFCTGDLVDVMRRFWPGSNKLGGVARIEKMDFSTEDETYVYDVTYVVVGGKERRVEEKYLKKYVDKRGTRSSKGRCSVCGSFGSDCFCHFDSAEEAIITTNTNQKSMNINRNQPNYDNNDDEESTVALSSDDDSDDDYNEKLVEPATIPVVTPATIPVVTSATVESMPVINVALPIPQPGAVANTDYVRALHKTLYDHCLHEVNKDDDIVGIDRPDLSRTYKQALNDIQELSIPNLQDLIRKALSLVRNVMDKSKGEYNNRTTLISSVESANRDEMEELAKGINDHEALYERRTRVIERVGFEVFRKCEKCFHKRMRDRLLYKPERRKLKQYLESAALNESQMSQDWGGEIKRHRDGIDKLKDLFRSKFGQTVEQALHFEAMDEEKEESSDDEIVVDQSRRKRKLVQEAASPRLRDAAVEASTLRKKPYHEEYVATEQLHDVPSSSSARYKNKRIISGVSKSTAAVLPRKPQTSFTFDAVDNKRSSSSSSIRVNQLSSATFAHSKRSTQDSSTLTAAVSKLTTSRHSSHQYTQSHQTDLSGYDDATNEQVSVHDVIRNHRQSFYRKLKQPVDHQATADGRVTVLEDSSYVLDTTNLSIPIHPHQQQSSGRVTVGDSEEGDDVAGTMFATLIASRTASAATATANATNAVDFLTLSEVVRVEVSPFSTDELVEYLHCTLESVLNVVEWQGASHAQWSERLPQFITLLTDDITAKLMTIQSQLAVVKASELQLGRLASTSPAKIALLIQAWQEIQMTTAKLEKFLSQLMFEPTVLKPFLRSCNLILEEMHGHIILSVASKVTKSIGDIFDDRNKLENNDKYGRLIKSLIDNITIMNLNWLINFLTNLPNQAVTTEALLQQTVEHVSHQTHKLLTKFLHNKVNLVDFQANMILSEDNHQQTFSACKEVNILLLSLRVLDQYYLRWKQLFTSSNATQPPPWLPVDVWQCVRSALSSLGSRQHGNDKVLYTLHRLKREDLMSSEVSTIKQESIWTVLMLATHHLRSLSNNQTVRVRSYWPIVKLLLSPESLANASKVTTGNAFMKCAEFALLWDNCNEGLSTFLHAVKSFVPVIINRFQAKTKEEDGEDIVATITKAKEMAFGNPKTLLFFTTTFARYTHQQPAPQGSWLHARNNLHKNLLLIVSILLRTCNLPSPYERYMEDLLLHVDESHRPSSSSSSSASSSYHHSDEMVLIDIIRSTFKMFLLNITSELKGDNQDLKTSVIHLKRAILFFKSNTLLCSVFDEMPSFLSGIMQCMLVKEVEISLSSDLVRVDMNCIDKMMHSFVNKRLLLAEGEDIVEENQQRSCLMFMTSLLIFNPFPIPSTRLITSNHPSISQQQQEQKDLNTMNPFNSMIKLIRTMCITIRQSNFNQLTDDMKQLLHAGLATSIAVLTHLDRCLMTQNGQDNVPVFAQQIVDDTIELLLLILMFKVERVDVVFVNAISLNTFAVLMRYIRSFTSRVFTANNQAVSPSLDAMITRLMNLWNSTFRAIFVATAKRCRIDYEHFSFSQAEFARRLESVPTMHKLDNMLANTNDNSKFNFAITSSCAVSTMITAMIDHIVILQLRETSLIPAAVKVGDILSTSGYIKAIVSKLDTIYNSSESNNKNDSDSGYLSCFLKFAFWDRLLSSGLQLDERYGPRVAMTLSQNIGSEAYLKDILTTLAAFDLVAHSKARVFGGNHCVRSLIQTLATVMRLVDTQHASAAITEGLLFADDAAQHTDLSMTELIIRHALTNPNGVIARWGIVSIILEYCFRAKRLLQNCLFQARKSHALICSNLNLLQRLCCLIQLAYHGTAPVFGVARVDTVAIASRFFNEFVIEVVVEALKQAAIIIRLHAQKANDAAIDAAKQDFAEAIQDFLSHLPLYISLAYQQPFATRCKEWEVILQPLVLFVHARHARKLPRTLRDEMQVIWKAVFCVEVSAHEDAMVMDGDVEVKNFSTTKMHGEIKQLLPSFDCNGTQMKNAQDQFTHYLFTLASQEVWKQATIAVDRALYTEKDYGRERLSNAQVDETIQEAIKCFLAL